MEDRLLYKVLREISKQGHEFCDITLIGKTSDLKPTTEWLSQNDFKSLVDCTLEEYKAKIGNEQSMFTLLSDKFIIMYEPLSERLLGMPVNNLPSFDKELAE